MADVNLIAGDDRSNSLHGSLGADLIYGWNPDGPQGSVSTITATRVASKQRFGDWATDADFVRD